MSDLSPDIKTPEDAEFCRDPDARTPIDTDPASYPELPEWKPAGNGEGSYT